MGLKEDVQRISVDSYMRGAREALLTLSEGFEAVGMNVAAQMTRDAMKIVESNRPGAEQSFSDDPR